MDKFEEVLMSWINGQFTQAYEQYKALDAFERDRFVDQLLEREGLGVEEALRFACFLLRNISVKEWMQS